MLTKESSDNKYLSQGTLWLMTIGAGLVVANNYYNLPLLGMIAHELNESEVATSRIPMFTQIGYACGLLLLVPLGDMFKRKKIILIDFIFIIASLLVFASGHSLNLMIVSGFFIGVTSVVPQIFVPIAAQLSKPEDKDKNVAQVMSGLLIGILASRVFSGLVGDLLGWKEVFLIAAGMMVVLMGLIIFLLPEMQTTFEGTYKQLMKSILYYAKTTPSLRLAAVRGGLAFASFSVFWTVLTFHLEQAPFYAGSDVAGLLGIVGIAGALSASAVGYLSNKVNKNTIILAGISFLIFSWLVYGWGGFTYAGLIVGIMFLDMGLQTVHVSNQTIVFSSHPEAVNRLNTIYMVSYFTGGAIGTFVGGLVWKYYGWYGTVVAGFIFAILCLLVHLTFSKKDKYKY